MLHPGRGYVWLAVCDACGHASRFPVRQLMNRYGDLCPVDQAIGHLCCAEHQGQRTVVHASSLAVLHAFNGSVGNTQDSNAGLARIGNDFYGTTSLSTKKDGGNGTIVRVTSDGKFRIVHLFAGGSLGSSPRDRQRGRPLNGQVSLSSRTAPIWV